MKINKKLAFDTLKSLAFSAFRPIATAEFKKVEKATPDKPVPFYFHMEHCFAKGKDKEDEGNGAKGLLAVFGKPDKKWKAEIKAKTKTEKKQTLFGKCYVELTPKGEKILNVYVSSGDATPDKLLRGVGKKLLTGVFGIVSINILGQIGEDALDEEEAELGEDGDEGQEPEPKDDASLEKRLMDLVNQYKSLVASVKAVIAQLLSGKKPEKGQEAGLNALRSNIQAFLQLLGTAKDDVKTKFQAAKDQMSKIMGILSGSGTKDDAKDLSDQVKQAEELKKLLDKALTTVEKLAIDVMLNKVAG